MISHNAEPLFERRAELAALESAVAAACSGDAGLVALEGAAGVGKTRLLGAACELAAERGLRVLRARGAELEREFSFGIARQLLEPLLAGAPPELRTQLLGGAAARVAPLFDDQELAPPGPDGRFAILHGLYWLAANLGERGPVLLAVDDLHWADAPSLQWLDFLARRLDGLAVALLVALRPGEPGADLELIEAIASQALVVRPASLSADASERLIRRVLPEDAEAGFCRACHEATGGNPLLLSELGRAIAAGGIPPVDERAPEILEIGPRAIARRVELRLARLPAEVTRLARSAAVLGDGATVASAAELAGLGADAGDRACATLVGLEILCPVATIEFVHPLVRAAVYAGLGPGERRRRHADAARVLARAGAGPQQVAAHLLLAPPAGEPAVVVTLREAARRALARGDSGGAASYLRRVLEEPPPAGERADVLAELGAVEMLVDGRAAVDHLREALALIADPVARAGPAEMLVRALLFAWRYDEGIELATRTIEELGDAEPGLRRRLEAAVLNASMFQPPHRELALRTADRVRARDGDDDGLGAKMLWGLLACVDAHACVPAAQAVAWAERALAGGTLIREANGGSPLVVSGIVLTAANPDRALALFDAALDAAVEQGSIFAFAAAMTYRSVVHLVRGDLSDAVADAERGLEAAEAHGLAAAPGFAAPNLANALIARGELDAAELALGRAGFGPDVPDTFPSLWYRDSRAQLLLARGETRRGLEATLECGRSFASVGGRNPAFLPWRSRAARALAALGEGAEARRLAAEELVLARIWGAPQAVGAALRARGVVEGGIESLEEAVTLLEGTPVRLELAGALVDLGAALRRARRPADSREPLRRGLELADRCGAAALAERAHAELLATGARPRRRALTGPDSLTPSERRVAEMAAAGRTNREIAEALFVTAKTVETHLGRAYLKLDIGSRQELADALGAR